MSHRIEGEEIINEDAVDTELRQDAHGLHDASWDPEHWEALLRSLIERGIFNWRDATTTILGELNPGQVGTQIASADASKYGFKENHKKAHPGESFMPYVIEWLYEQDGRCIEDGCETRLDLQADHLEGREKDKDNPRQFDRLDNLGLRCRRHNVAKRSSHELTAGRTLLPAQQALMWILLEIQPRTERDFARLCRLYGMTMAEIRFQESWAMAVWLDRSGDYEIEDEVGPFDVIQWPDGGLTRRPTGVYVPADCTLLEKELSTTDVVCVYSIAPGDAKPRYTELRISDLPFEYKLGDISPSALSVWPLRKDTANLAPRGHTTHGLVFRSPGQHCQLRGPRRVKILQPSTFGRGFYKGRVITLARATEYVLEVVDE